MKALGFLLCALMIFCCGCGKEETVATTLPTTTNIIVTSEVETEVKTEAPTTVYIPPTTEAPTTVYIPPTTEAPTTVSSDMRYFSVNGVTPPFEFQEYLYKKLCEFGVEWFYPTAICQIYQESNWNQWSDNGRDRGICQFKEIYWADKALAAGWAGADIWDPYAQLHVYAFFMSEYLRAADYNVGLALSTYYVGRVEWSDVYVSHVMRWIDYLKEVWR